MIRISTPCKICELQIDMETLGVSMTNRFQYNMLWSTTTNLTHPKTTVDVPKLGLVMDLVMKMYAQSAERLCRAYELCDIRGVL